MNDLNKAKQQLLSSGCTCVLRYEDDVVTSSERGVKPLVAWIESGKNFKNYSAADKVVGKATAFLYLMLGVTAVYAGVISKSALKLLNEHHVTVEYGNLAENIVNRRGDGICPFEAAVLETQSSQAAYEIIRGKMREMNITVRAE